LRGRLLNAYALCPAFAYFKLHYPEPPTPSMEYGKEVDVREIVEKFIGRKCKVQYSVYLKGKLGSGIADAVVICGDWVEVVEVKLSEGFLKPQLLQAGFYCLLAEETFGAPCRSLWLCSPKGCFKRRFSGALRESVLGMVESLQRDLERGMPRGKPSRYCSYCKYSSICPWRRGE